MKHNKIEFELLKDFEGYKKGEKFDCMNGLVFGISTKDGTSISGKSKSVDFKDKSYFKMVK